MDKKLIERIKIELSYSPKLAMLLVVLYEKKLFNKKDVEKILAD